MHCWKLSSLSRVRVVFNVEEIVFEKNRLVLYETHTDFRIRAMVIIFSFGRRLIARPFTSSQYYYYLYDKPSLFVYTISSIVYAAFLLFVENPNKSQVLRSSKSR